MGVATDPPAAPINLGVQAVSTNSITLAWTDTSGNELGFQVERCSGAGTWARVASLGANTTGYADADAGLSEAITYGYRVRAYNTVGSSTYSNEASATTVFAAPTQLTAAPLSDTRIDLTWTDNSASETAYRLERKTGASGTWDEIATLEPNVTTYSDTGLAAPVTYVYRVRAANPVGYSGYSNEASATTLIPPSAPTNLTASAVSATRIQLIWEDRSDIEWEVQIERKTGADGTGARSPRRRPMPPAMPTPAWWRPPPTSIGCAPPTAPAPPLTPMRPAPPPWIRRPCPGRRWRVPQPDPGGRWPPLGLGPQSGWPTR